MKIEIELDDVDIFEKYEDYDEEYKNAKEPGHRRWGRVSWLYPGDMLVEIGGESARKIQEAMKERK